MKLITPPTIHLNGSSGQTLLDQYRTAADALFAARRALAETNPNARDYYMQTDEAAYNKARAEHDSRAKRLLEVEQELEALVESVLAQVEARERR